ncbi:hypothetical protein DL766_008019 [Monosporascus sp. MC13-8B]|uniref:Sphingomyelin phosphodiesterase n=1 Tax=Monosporascus cannonballus TaxID=155416 RepID=A0ABY0HAC8_9PEZI|nr:hypothetical protein DL762_003926 [Monosporascus cannonballus]RYO94839.1 hypothetical protein DL763_003943 [Monosporascus cannonballus]RYP21093.1 hypothetical protein DL766_008019 [Monosporascus sp. MC13-8B]
MRAATCAVTALALARHAVGEWIDGESRMAQKPLVQASPEQQDDEVLRLFADLGRLGMEADMDFRGLQGCALCEAALLWLKASATKGDEDFVGVVTASCKRLQIEDDDVCEGSVSREGPIVARALRDMRIGSRTSRLFCAATMGLCSYPEFKHREIPFPSPKKPDSGGPPPSGREPLKIIHFSDIHVDPFYVEGSNANCTKPICCRDYSDTDPSSDYDVPAGPNGNHKCDVPVSLEESMYAAIKSAVPEAAFSIFTGDIVDHAVWNTTEAQNKIDIKGAYHRMSKAGLFVYGTAGNHESSPTNSYPPEGVSDSAQWVYDLLSSAWSRWIGPGPAAETKDFGAYSVKYPGGDLRIISINTNLHYRHNFWLYQEPMEADPSGQLAWLVSELDAAEKADERVYIIGHMPPGSGDTFHEGSNYLDQIINRYSSTIAALFFGHTHQDEFQISYSDYENRNFSNAAAMSYVVPSLAPTSGHPAFRVYEVDPVTFGVLDVTTYIANMSDPDFHRRTNPTWMKYYSARETYGPLVSPPLAPLREKKPDAELTPAFWHNVTEALERNATAFEAFMARKRRGWRPDACDTDDCVAAEICRLRGARAQDNCISPSSRLGLVGRGGQIAGVSADSWRSLGFVEDREDECESSIIRDTLGVLGMIITAGAAI